MEQITVIRDLLPHGAQKEIAEKISVSQVRVNQVLAGKVQDLKIIDAVIDYYAAYKEKRDKSLKRLSALV